MHVFSVEEEKNPASSKSLELLNYIKILLPYK